jgi:diguanylate cyclase (GGDEF)-like protein
MKRPMDPHVHALKKLIEVRDASENRHEALHHLALLERSLRQMKFMLEHLVRKNHSLKCLMAQKSKDFEEEVLKLEAKSAELTKVDDRMKLAEQVARFGVWEASHRTETMTISQGLKALLRLPAEQPLEMSFAEWSRLIHPKDTAEVAGIVAKAAEEPDFEAELRVNLPDGTTRWHRVRAQGEFVEGRLVRGIGMTIDVTTERETLNALRAAEAALQREKRGLMDARERLRDQATHDGLTRLWNRTAILEILERELERGCRQGHVTGLVLADIDFFKKVNDTYGHQAGDAVLCEVTRRLSSVIRSYDSLGRYGGEEFLLVMPNCCVERYASRVERMRSAIADTPFLAGDTAFAMTCSFGSVCSAPGRTTARDLIRLADESLYRAKALGRNRVEVHERTGARPPAMAGRD